MRSTHRPGLYAAVLIVAGLFHSEAPAAADPLIFTSPPRETPEAGEKMYGPIAAHLSQLLGRPVEYRHPGQWLAYARDMRAGAYDIVFDGPHFVAWRMAHLDHKVLVKLPGELTFNVIARTDVEKPVENVSDLVGRAACCIAPPNLATMSMIGLFPNPARQPTLVSVKGGFEGVFKSLVSGRCDVGSVRSNYYDGKLTAEQKKNLRVIATTKPLPDQAFTAGPRVSAAERAKIAATLTTGSGQATTVALLKRFAPKAKALVPANEAEYEGHNRLLEGVVFGW